MTIYIGNSRNYCSMISLKTMKTLLKVLAIDIRCVCVYATHDEVVLYMSYLLEYCKCGWLLLKRMLAFFDAPGILHNCMMRQIDYYC